jgi:hypothetical protein
MCQICAAMRGLSPPSIANAVPHIRPPSTLLVRHERAAPREGPRPPNPPPSLLTHVTPRGRPRRRGARTDAEPRGRHGAHTNASPPPPYAPRGTLGNPSSTSQSARCSSQMCCTVRSPVTTPSSVPAVIEIVSRSGVRQNRLDPHRRQNPRWPRVALFGPQNQLNSPSGSLTSTSSRDTDVYAPLVPCERRHSTQWHTTTSRMGPRTS